MWIPRKRSSQARARSFAADQRKSRFIGTMPALFTNGRQCVFTWAVLSTGTQKKRLGIARATARATIRTARFFKGQLIATSLSLMRPSQRTHEGIFDLVESPQSPH